MFKKSIASFSIAALIAMLLPMQAFGATAKPSFTTLVLQSSKDEINYTDLVGNLADGYVALIPPYDSDADGDPANEFGDFYTFDIDDDDTHIDNGPLADGYHGFYLDNSALPQSFFDYWDTEHGVNASADGSSLEGLMWDIIGETGAAQEPSFYIYNDEGKMLLIDGLSYLVDPTTVQTFKVTDTHEEYPEGLYSFFGTITNTGGVESDEITIDLTISDTEIYDFEISDTDINPSAGEEIDVSFSLAIDGFVTVEVVASDDDTVKATLVDNADLDAGDYDKNSTLPGAEDTFTWDGTDGTDTLTDGDYYILVSYSDTDGGAADYEEASDDITLADTDIIKPIVITYPNAGTYFDPADTGDVEIDFEFSEDVTDVEAVLKNPDGITIKTKTAAAVSADTEQSLDDWDGTYPAGELAIPGDYPVAVTAKINGNTVTKTENLVVKYDNSNKPAVDIKSIAPDPFDPDLEDTKITFEITNSFDDVIVEIRKSDGNLIKTLTNEYLSDPDDSDLYYVRWDGVSTDGIYTVRVIVRDDDNGVAIDEDDVEIKDRGDLQTSNTHIGDLRFSPSSKFEPEEDDVLKIKFDVKQDLDELTIYAVRGDDEIEIESDSTVDEENNVEYEWDGQDDDDEYVDKGDWRIEIRTKVGSTELIAGKTIEIDYSKPEIDEMLFSKDEIDNDIGEITNLLFKIDSDAEVDIFIYQDGSEDDELIEDMEVTKNEWYAVEWDGGNYDYDDDIELKLFAKNIANNNVFDSKKLDLNLKEEDVSSTKSNVTNDYMSPPIADNNDELELSYELEDDADVKVTIHKGTSASGSAVITLLDIDDQDSGEHTITWDGKDDDGDTLSDGKYSWKIVSRKSSSETEEGVFIIGDLGDSSSSSGGTIAPNVTVNGTGDHSSSNDDSTKCAGFSDVLASSKYCDAIDWAKDEGIFVGYSDGTFKPYQAINRVEVLKVILEAMNITVDGQPGTTLGFRDVILGEWYMPYLSTAKDLGIFHGDAGIGTARPADPVNRVEALKFGFESLRVYTGYTTTTCSIPYPDVITGSWYYNYSCESKQYNLFDLADGINFNPELDASRGDVALMLYRMDQVGLL